MIVASPPAPAMARPGGDVRWRLPRYAERLMLPARYKSLRGGRGAGKSHTFAQLALMRMMGILPDYPEGPVRIASARDIESSIKESVKTLVEYYIDLHGLKGEFDVKNYEIDHVPTGSHMYFPGIAKKVDSWLSMEGIDVFWAEQAEKLGEEMIKIDPTIRKPGAERWFSWNPLGRTSWCWQRFVVHPQPDDVNLKVTYVDNPWFDAGMNTTRLEWLERDPVLYPWMYGGIPNDGDASATVLSYDVLEKCVEAYRRGLHEGATGVRYMGFDVAEGGADKCAVVIRDGPVVRFVAEWPGVSGDLSIAAAKAKEHATDHGGAPSRIYYDASSPMKTDLIRAGFLGVRAVNFGGSVGGPDTLYESRRPNKEVFCSRNIQMATNLRLRANRTVRLMNGDENIRLHECLFVDPAVRRLDAFLTDLTQPTRRLNPTTGKWELDKRGGDENAKSPDSFDALCLAFGYDTDGRGLKVR